MCDCRKCEWSELRWGDEGELVCWLQSDIEYIFYCDWVVEMIENGQNFYCEDYEEKPGKFLVGD